MLWLISVCRIDGKSLTHSQKIKTEIKMIRAKAVLQHKFAPNRFYCPQMTEQINIQV